MLKEDIIMRGKQLGFPRLSKKSHDNQATMIATIVQEAIEAEREACAKVAICYDSEPWKHTPAYSHVADMVSVEIGKAIRARGNKE